MQIVIDIPEYIYKFCQGHGDIVYKYIAKGTPLPKGHEQSIDADIIINEFYERYPKNYMGGLELNGSSCVFSYNDIVEIINNIIKSRNTNDKI